jgi:GcrA cell cycle regulator
MTDAAGTWTDDRVEQLKKLWSEGFSASQIAAEMGGVTRNAVIGKVHRLGLSGRGKTNAPGAARPRKPRPTGVAPAAPPTPFRGNTALAAKFAPRPEAQPLPEVRLDEDVVIPFSERVTIMELREFMCRWPMGDPTKPDFRFCGGQANGSLPYCSHHARIAYQPATERKRIRA